MSSKSYTCKLLRPFTYVPCPNCTLEKVGMFYFNKVYVCNECLHTIPSKNLTPRLDVEKWIRHIQQNIDNKRICKRLVQAYLRWNGFGDMVYDMQLINKLITVISELTEPSTFNVGRELVKIIKLSNPWIELLW